MYYYKNSLHEKLGGFIYTQREANRDTFTQQYFQCFCLNSSGRMVSPVFVLFFIIIRAKSDLRHSPRKLCKSWLLSYRKYVHSVYVLQLCKGDVLLAHGPVCKKDLPNGRERLKHLQWSLNTLLLDKLPF